MNAPASVDTLIIGHGLAGGLLAWELLKRGENVMVADAADGTAASRTAAGLLNPVTGQRLVRTAQLERLLPAALALYRELENEFGGRFFHPRPMRRLFQDASGRERWQARRQEAAYAEYLESAEPAGAEGASLHDPHGSGLQRHTGFLDTVGLLDALEEYLRRRGRLLTAAVDYGALRLGDGLVEWNGVQARRAVFCEGWRAGANPWFDWLPFQPAKGEILTLEAAGPLPACIVNARRWLLPLDERRFRLGATYQWQPLDERPTAAARDELTAELPRLLRRVPPVSVIDHRAGVRAGTRDRQPFLGLHPSEPRLGIFNGLGAKATLLAPWHAARLADFLTGSGTLPPEADVRRYWR